MAPQGRQGKADAVAKKPGEATKTTMTEKKKRGSKNNSPTRVVATELPYVTDGLELVRTEADGNCLFRAISKQLYGTADKHLVLRQLAVRHQCENAAQFEGFCTATMAKGGREMRRTTRAATSTRSPDEAGVSLFEQRMNLIRQAGQWGDEPEVLALALACHVSIKVYHSDGSVPREYNTMAGDRLICLNFDGSASHYSGLRAVGSEGRALGDYRELVGAKHLEIRDDDNVSTRSFSSKRSLSDRDEDDGSDECRPKKKAHTAERWVSATGPCRVMPVSKASSAPSNTRRVRLSSATSSSSSTTTNSNGFTPPSSAGIATPDSSADEMTSSTTTITKKLLQPNGPRHPSESKQKAATTASAAKPLGVKKHSKHESAGGIRTRSRSRLAERAAMQEDATGNIAKDTEVKSEVKLAEDRERQMRREQLTRMAEWAAMKKTSRGAVGRREAMLQYDGATDEERSPRLGTPSDTSSTSGLSFMVNLEL